MTEVTRLIATIKRKLKAAGLTYRDVAQALDLSEPSIKRLLSEGRLTVDRLAQFSELLSMTMSELLMEAEAPVTLLHGLSADQEAALVASEKQLLVTVCALSHWSIDDIVSAYRLSEAECVKYLLVLDRMEIIELKPGNRIRLRVARDFDWLPDGPIRNFFLQQALPDFMKSRFDVPGEVMGFAHGMLTQSAYEQLQIEMRKLRARFSALHDQSVDAPLADRRGTALLLTARAWEPEAFRSLRRAESEPPSASSVA
ncbi:helix-turn-helix transcriptional regulator [Paraburkholderia sp. D15]|uniref:helix-turn-helix domain-containing protein n=1 Tax=Paraburkholderia sp. D15 TaxID=2880218 RepID=UPI002478A3A4|nr:helix-turn-helix transcriptional regulator [Paraburkholderia sp. D15]WGS52958.1 helix-turn-helix transcriptional regulator [Paraburkholderia sp. D15]